MSYRLFIRHLDWETKYSACRLMFLVFLITFLSGCSTIGTDYISSTASPIQALKFNVPADQQRVVIYNHGVTNSELVEHCFMPYNKPPASLTSLIDNKLLVYRLCSTSTDAPEPAEAGKQVYRRKLEINHAIDAFLARGVKPKHLFLAGHSNGAWTSLMMMHDVNKRFNGVIAYAPAFAGRRDESNIYPWWRKTVRPKQIKDMLSAPEMDALVFAYENDAYNRPQDLQFLSDHYPLKLSGGVDLVAYDCNNFFAHQTFRNDCRLKDTTMRVRRFVESQIESWVDY